MTKAIVKNNSDTAWKEILEVCFKDFMDYCLPQVSAKIDWNKPVTFLDKELLAITKDNLIGNRYVDKLISVYLIGGMEQWILVHIEVQGAVDKKFTLRMFTYAYRIFDRYQRPVLSCAILTDENKDWRPNRYETGTDGSCLSLDFIVIKLIDYRGRGSELEASPNVFASVILTQLKALLIKKSTPEKRLNMKFDLTRRLYGKGYNKAQIKSLFIFIDWLIQLPEELVIEYENQVYELEEATKMAYMHSIERLGMERGIKQGRQEGLQEGEATLLTRLLTLKFGGIPPYYQKKIELSDSNTILYWADRVFEAQTLEEIFKD